MCEIAILLLKSCFYSFKDVKINYKLSLLAKKYVIIIKFYDYIKNMTRY